MDPQSALSAALVRAFGADTWHSIQDYVKTHDESTLSAIKKARQQFEGNGPMQAFLDLTLDELYQKLNREEIIPLMGRIMKAEHENIVPGIDPMEKKEVFAEMKTIAEDIARKRRVKLESFVSPDNFEPKLS